MRLLIPTLWFLGLFCRAAIAADLYEARPGGMPTHLVPVPPCAGDAYEALVYQHLTGKWGGGPFGSMLVLPSFDPEYCISIYADAPEEQRYMAVAARVSESLWAWSQRNARNEPTNKIEVTQKSRPVSLRLAVAVQRVWALSLLCTRYSADAPPIVADGVTYRFSVFVGGLGDLYGQCHSPDKGTLRALIDVGHALRAFVDDDNLSTTTTEDQLIDLLTKLESKITGA